MIARRVKEFQYFVPARHAEESWEQWPYTVYFDFIRQRKRITGTDLLEISGYNRRNFSRKSKIISNFSREKNLAQNSKMVKEEHNDEYNEADTRIVDCDVD